MDREELPMHKDTYYFGYGIDIEKPDEMARQITKLKEENQELINQQKEFIEWLEQNIENEEYCYLAQNPGERCRKDVFEEVLSKYKEIVGGSDD